MMLEANPGRNLIIEVDGRTYARIPIRTHLIKPFDDITEIVTDYIQDSVTEEDIVVISERVVAITQGRVVPIAQSKPSRLAVFLSRFVYKSPYGIGVGSPWTMELAIKEVGWFRIVVGAVVGALGKLLGIRGLFYRVCGERVRGIDGPCANTIAPYDQCAVLVPEDSQRIAEELGSVLGCFVAVIDANDLGVNILGVSSSDLDTDFLVRALRDNPLGQSSEQTPIGIIRCLEDSSTTVFEEGKTKSSTSVLLKNYPNGAEGGS